MNNLIDKITNLNRTGKITWREEDFVYIGSSEQLPSDIHLSHDGNEYKLRIEEKEFTCGQYWLAQLFFMVSQNEDVKTPKFDRFTRVLERIYNG